MFHEVWPLPAQWHGGPLSREAYLNYTNWKLPTNRHRLKWLARRIPSPHGRAVDIGTRDGSVVKLLGDRGWQAIGFEPDERWAAHARAVHGVEVRAEWFTAEAVGHGTLSLVTAYHVFEHVPDPLPWLTEIWHSLAPDGYLHMETPNLRRVRGTQIIPSHHVLYTAHTLRQMLQQAGFTVLAVTEYAPGGHRTWDCLGILAQRVEPKPVAFALSDLDRSAQHYLAHPTPEMPISRIPPVHFYRRVKRRLGVMTRRARYHAPI